MSSEPKVSLFGAAIRTEKWLEFYAKIINSNRTPIEIIFVGPKKPDYKLPENFLFIPSDFKPAQCAAIAAENARTNVLLQVVDDIEFSPGAIDQMFDGICKFPKAAMTCHYFFGDEDNTLGQNLLGRPTEVLPLVPVCGMFRRELFLKAGGLDKRFQGVLWELDLYMRLMADFGVETRFIDGVCREPTEINPLETRLANRTWGHDRGLINQLWNLEAYLADKEPALYRKEPVSSYDSKTITTRAQA